MGARQFTHGERAYQVDRGVFDPVHHLSGLVLADHLSEVLAPVAPAGARIVDVGTGCGLLAATAAQAGYHVVATDSSPAAVSCASSNTMDLDVDVRAGDLFEALAGERFAVMVVNPPYEVGPARPWANATVRSPDFLTRCAAGWATFADHLVLGFPAEEGDLLVACGFAVDCWRILETEGRPLGIYVG